MNNKQKICDGCELLFDEIYLYKYKSSKSYCINCRLTISNIAPSDIETINQEELDKMLKTLLKSPSLKLKDLKEQLKKEREKKRNLKDKRGSK